MAFSSCVFYTLLCAAATIAVLLDLQYGSLWATKEATKSDQPYGSLSESDSLLEPLKPTDGVNGVVHKGTSFVGTGQFASDVNPFHAASLPGRFGTGGRGQQQGSKGSNFNSNGGGTFKLETTDDAAPEFAAAVGDSSGGISHGIEALEGGMEVTEQDLSLGAAVGTKAVVLPLGSSSSSSSSGYSASDSAPERLDTCSKVRCAETGFGSHPKVDLWGGAAGGGDIDTGGTGGTDHVVCASKSAAPLDGLCLVGAGTFASARTTCQRAGARLCTAGEMSRGLGWNTGCGSSMPFLWTQTRCNASSSDSDHSGHRRYRGRRHLLSDVIPAPDISNISDSQSNNYQRYRDRRLSSITVSTARLAKAYQQKMSRHHRDAPASNGEGNEHFLLLSQQRLLGGSSKHMKCGNVLRDHAEGPPVCCADAKCPDEEANKAADWAAEAESRRFHEAQAAPPPITNGRVAVLLIGDTGLPRCTMAGRSEQIAAIGWQKDLVFAMLRAKGFGVDVFLATNDCGSGWREALKRAYAPWLRAASVSDGCLESGRKDKVCHLRAALTMLDLHSQQKCTKGRPVGFVGAGAAGAAARQNAEMMGAYYVAQVDSSGGNNNRYEVHRHSSSTSSGSLAPSCGETSLPFETILLMRPNTVPRPRLGAALVMDLVSAAQSSGWPKSDHLAWPFRCGYGSETSDFPPETWRDWRCVSDSMMAIPGTRFTAFRNTCLGRRGCFGASKNAPPFAGDEEWAVRSDGSLALGPGPGGDSVGAAMPLELATSGRGCFRCASRALERAPTRHKVLNHTDLAYSNPYKCFSIPLRPPTTTTTSSTTTRQEEEEEKSTHANWNSSVFSRSSTSSRPTSAQKYVSLHEASMRCQAACSTEGPDPAAKAAAAQAHRQHRQHLSSSGGNNNRNNKKNGDSSRHLPLDRKCAAWSLRKVALSSSSSTSTPSSPSSPLSTTPTSAGDEEEDSSGTVPDDIAALGLTAATCSRLKCRQTSFQASDEHLGGYSSSSSGGGNNGDGALVCASKTASPLDGSCDLKDGSWFEAKEVCESAGTRLCSLQDLTAGLGWGTGCHSNRDFLWTGTPCADPPADSYGWYYQVNQSTSVLSDTYRRCAPMTSHLDASPVCCADRMCSPRAIMSTYEHPTEQSDQHKSAKNQDEGEDGEGIRSSGSRQGSPMKSHLSSGGVLGDFTETLRANDDDSSSSRSSGGGGRGIGLGRTRAPAWSYLANSGLTGSSSSGSDIAEEQPPVAPAPVTSGASEQQQQQQLLLHRDWFPEALAVDSKKEAQVARRERLKRQAVAKAAAHALAEAAASNDMSEELEGENGEEGGNSEVTFGGATFQALGPDIDPQWTISHAKMRSHHNQAAASTQEIAPALLDASASASGSGNGNGGGGRVSVAGSGAAAVSRGQKQNRGKLAGEKVMGRRSSRHSEGEGAEQEGGARLLPNENVFASPSPSRKDAPSLRGRGSAGSGGSSSGNNRMDGRNSGIASSSSSSSSAGGSDVTARRSWANAAAAGTAGSGGSSSAGGRFSNNIWSGGSGWSNSGASSYRRQLFLVDDEKLPWVNTTRDRGSLAAAPPEWPSTAVTARMNTTAADAAGVEATQSEDNHAEQQSKYGNTTGATSSVSGGAFQSGNELKFDSNEITRRQQQHRGQQSRRLGCKWVQHKGQMVCGDGSSSSSATGASNAGSRSSSSGGSSTGRKNNNRWSRTSSNSGGNSDGNRNNAEGDNGEGKLEALNGDDEAAGHYPLSKARSQQQRNSWGPQHRGGEGSSSSSSSGGHGARSRQRRKSDSSSSSSNIDGSTSSEGGDVLSNADNEDSAGEGNVWAASQARNFKKRFENKNRAQESDTAQVPLQEASHLDTFNRASARNAKHQALASPIVGLNWPFPRPLGPRELRMQALQRLGCHNSGIGGGNNEDSAPTSAEEEEARSEEAFQQTINAQVYDGEIDSTNKNSSSSSSSSAQSGSNNEDKQSTESLEEAEDEKDREEGGEEEEEEESDGVDAQFEVLSSSSPSSLLSALMGLESQATQTSDFGHSRQKKRSHRSKSSSSSGGRGGRSRNSGGARGRHVDCSKEPPPPPSSSPPLHEYNTEGEAGYMCCLHRSPGVRRAHHGRSSGVMAVAPGRGFAGLTLGFVRDEAQVNAARESSGGSDAPFFTMAYGKDRSESDF